MHKRAALQRFFASFTVIVTLSTSVAPAFAQELPVEEVPQVSQNTIETPSVVVAEPATEPATAPEAAVSTTIPGQTGEEPLVETKIVTTSPDTEATQSSVMPPQTMATTSEDLPLDKPKQATALLPYSELMREIAKAATPDQKQAALKDLLVFIDAEKERLASSPLDETAKNEYIQFLELQKQVLGEPAPEQSFIERAVDAVKGVFGFESDKFKKLEPSLGPTINIPEQPARFQSIDENRTIHSVKDLQLFTKQSQTPALLSNIWATPAFAANNGMNLPTIEDVGQDLDVTINEEIRSLAQSLDKNPLKITNYLRRTISYEPYFGSKKGSIGCLREKSCNDVDASSLAIALMRAAGIPAHFKESLIVMSTSTWRNILGADDTKAAFKTGMYFFTLNPDNDGKFLADADLSKEQSLAVLWVHPEIFYPYDERGGNFSNALNTSSATTTQELQAMLADTPSRQWVGIDIVVKNYKREKKPIVADEANFDSKAFWEDFLKYQGALKPLEKYQSDLIAKVNKDPFAQGYQSTKIITADDLTVLPASLPYDSSLSKVWAGIYNPKIWAQLPERMRTIETITLKSNNQIVLQKQLYGPEVNNVPLTVRYEGATPQDQSEIEAHGGIAYAPAGLVDITPVLTSDVVTATTSEKVKIGDRLMLQFDYSYNGNIIFTDQKYSIAGNEEGIFIALSRVQANPQLQTPSQILSAGTAEIAREYLRFEQEQWDLVGRSLDYQFNKEVDRAVVTQNRILNAVNGVPTTFDFSGLTVDASVGLRDFSNRGSYDNHQKDFGRMWGLEASRYEGQLFADLASLKGISTISGLQYAYNNPQTYSVYTFSSTTPNYEQAINGLNLPGSTRQALINEVNKNRIVTTPNKILTRDAFTGVVYISMWPNGFAGYFIGEQVQNGGMTLNQYTLKQWQNQQNAPQYAYEYINGPQQFIYKDNVSNNVFCNIKVASYNDIVNGNKATGWDISKYGKPCMDDNENGPYKFGTHDHSLILSTDGAYFKSTSDNYDYWIRNATIVNKLQQKIQDEIVRTSTMRQYWGTYAFGNSATNWKAPQNIRRLAMFNPKTQEAYVITGKMAEKYTSPATITGLYTPNLLGYPTSDVKPAATSFSGTKGEYQNFLNGQMYLRDGWFSDSVYPVAGKIAEYFNGQNAQRGGVAGSGGVFGFPTTDQQKNVNILTQSFEEATLEEQNGQVSEISQTTESRRYQNQEFALKELQKVQEGAITDIEAFKFITNYIGQRRNISKDDFVKDATVLFVGEEHIALYQLLRQALFGSAFDEYTVNSFSDTGFKFKFNDSHYCIRLDGLSNQLYHSMGGLNIGYFMGQSAAVVGDIIHEDYMKLRFKPSPLGTGGSSIEDSNLTVEMGILGADIHDGKVKISEVGDAMYQKFADVNNNNLRKTRSQLKNECDIRRQFRDFERDTFGDPDIFTVWYYSTDMALKNGKYTQYYEKFGNLRNVEAVWDEQQKKVLLIQK